MRIKYPRSSNSLTISWIGRISIVALIASLAALVLNAFTIKDTTLFAACLTIAAIATNGVGALGGHLQKEDEVLKQAEISLENGSPRLKENNS